MLGLSGSGLRKVDLLHRLRNPGKIPLEIIEVQSGSYLGEDDIERFEDIYGRSTPVERGVSVKTIAQ